MLYFSGRRAATVKRAMFVYAVVCASVSSKSEPYMQYVQCRCTYMYVCGN